MVRILASLVQRVNCSFDFEIFRNRAGLELCHTRSQVIVLERMLHNTQISWQTSFYQDIASCACSVKSSKKEQNQTRCNRPKILNLILISIPTWLEYLIFDSFEIEDSNYLSILANMVLFVFKTFAPWWNSVVILCNTVSCVASFLLGQVEYLNDILLGWPVLVFCLLLVAFHGRTLLFV